MLILADARYIPVNNGSVQNGFNRRREISNGSDAPSRAVNAIGGREAGLKPKDLVGIPWRVAFALQADGWYLRADIIWSKPNPMPESVQDRPTKAHEYIFLMSKSDRYFYDGDIVSELAIRSGEWNNATPQHAEYSMHRVHQVGERRNRRSVWTVATQPYPEAHFATFPPKLIEPCILAGSRMGDLVLDPFAGSGTTCLVAERFGRRAIGLDLSGAYLTLAQERLALQTMPLPIPM